jgi:hypothetical protein
MMRESEAKNKVCPIMQGPSATTETCLGSGCMLWREGPPLMEAFAIGDARLPTAPPPGDGWFLGVNNDRPAWLRTTDTTGYCGLVKP